MIPFVSCLPEREQITDFLLDWLWAHNQSRIFEGLKEVLRIRAILAFMGFPQPPTVCHVDTEAGIRALNKRVPSNATKHFDIRFFRILQGIDTQEIALHWVDTDGGG